MVSVDPSLHQPVSKTEIKIIDNNLDHQLSADIDKLNESLYKINNFIKLTKEIDELKKENLVKNDIKRKLSLKEQWLKNSQDSGLNNFGSTKSVNFVGTNSDLLSNQPSAKAMSVSNLDLAKSSPLMGHRRKLYVAPTGSFQNLKTSGNSLSLDHSHREDPIGELGFLNNLDITDNEIEILSQDPEFKYVSPQDRLKSNNDKLAKSLKKIESKNFSETRNHIKSQMNAPKVSTTQRDLSKFFPKKEEKATSANVNKNQKELKDVNLAKYFAPSPVQELKSLPSPCLTPKSNQSPSLTPRSGPSPNLTPSTGLSPVMPRRNSNLDSKTVDLKQSLLRETVENKLKPNKTKSFDMYNQQMDGAVDWKKPSKRELEKARSIDVIEVKTKKKKDDSPPEEIDLSNFERLVDDPVLFIERSPSREYNQLFENETLDEDFNEMFEEFAAKVVPKPVETKMMKKPLHKKKTPPKDEVKEYNLTYSKPAPKWCKKEIVDHNNVQAMCLAKFSDKLMNEIKQLEEQIGENVTNTTTKKSLTTDRTTEEKVKKPSPKKVVKKVVKTVNGEPKVVTKKVVKKSDKISDNTAVKSDSSSKPASKPKSLIKKERSKEDILFDEVCASNSVMDDINLLERTIYSVPSVERLRANEISPKPVPPTQNNLQSITTMKPLTNSVHQLPTSTKVAPAKPVRRNKSMSSSNSPDVPPRKNTLLGSVTKLYHTIKNAATSTPSSPPKDAKQSNNVNPTSQNNVDVDVPDGNVNGVSSNLTEAVAPKPSTKILFRYKPITVVRYATPPSIKKPIIQQQRAPENAVLTGPVSNGVELNRHKVLERQLAFDNLNHNGYDATNATKNNVHNSSLPMKNDSELKFEAPSNNRHSNHEIKVHSLEDVEQPKRYSLNYEDAVSSHYDNVTSIRHQSPGRPEKPPRKLSERDRETDRLIERSQMIHNRKEEFMNAKLSGSNPYMKKVIDDERFEGSYGFSRSRDELSTDTYYPKSRDEPSKLKELRRDVLYGRSRDEDTVDRSYGDGYGGTYGIGVGNHTYGNGTSSQTYGSGGSGLNTHLYGSGGSGLNSHSYGSGTNLHYSTPYGSSTLSRPLPKKNSITSTIPSNQSNSRIFTTPSSTTSKYGLGIFHKKPANRSSASSKDNCTIS